MSKRFPPRVERFFFTLTAVWFVVLTLVGFGPTFFRRIPEPLPTHQIVHGVLFSTWVLLFLVQALLITTRHVRWRMKLGMASVAVLILMIPAGFHVVLVKAAGGLKTVDEAGANLTALTFGFGLAFAGLAFRRRFETKVRGGKELPPHRDWVKNVFLPRMEKALNRAEKILEKMA